MLSTFFVAEGTDFSANQIEVDGDEAHHGVNVLRLKTSEEVKINPLISSFPAKALVWRRIASSSSLAEVSLLPGIATMAMPFERD